MHDLDWTRLVKKSPKIYENIRTVCEYNTQPCVDEAKMPDLHDYNMLP